MPSAPRFFVTTAAVIASCAGSLVAQSTFTWNGGNGSWIENGKWDTGVFPDYHLSVDTVRIDGGKAGASRVDFTGHTLPGPYPQGPYYSFHTRRLEITAGDELLLNEGGRLQIRPNGFPDTTATQVVNEGTISLSRVPRAGYHVGELHFYRTTLSGGGTIALGVGTNPGTDETGFSMQANDFSGAAPPLINQDNLIRGRGVISGPLHNGAAGVLSADVNAPGVKLTLSHNGYGQLSNGVPVAITTNQNRFEAKNGGTLELNLGRLINVGGIVEALPGSTLSLNIFEGFEPVPANVNDPQRELIRARNRQRGVYGGILRNNGGTARIDNTFLNGTAPGGLQLEGVFAVKRATLLGTIVNKGTIELGPGSFVNGYQNYDILSVVADSDKDGVNDTPLVLDGGGTLRLTGPGSYIDYPFDGATTGAVTIENKNNLIEGQGLIYSAAHIHNHPPIFENGVMTSAGGRISANVPGGQLRIAGTTGQSAPAFQGLTNEGLLEAKSGGILKLDTARIFQGNTGVIEVDAASRLSLAGMQIEGGTIRNVTATGEPNFAPGGANTGVHLSATGLLDGRPNNGQPQPVKLLGAFYLDDLAALAGRIMAASAGQARIIAPTNTAVSLVDAVTMTNGLELRLDGGAIQGSESSVLDRLIVDDFSRVAGWGTTNAPLEIAPDGQLRANVADQELAIAAPISNAGLISAEGGGQLRVGDLVVNDAGAVVRAGTDGVITLQAGGRIRNGTLDRLNADGTVIGFGGTLENVTVAGPGSSADPTLHVLGGLQLSSTLINNAWISALNSQIGLQGLVVVEGDGTLQLDGSTISSTSANPAEDGLTNRSEIRGSGSIDVVFANAETGLIVGDVPDAALRVGTGGTERSINRGQIAGADGGLLVVDGYLQQQRNGAHGGTLNAVGTAGAVRIDGTLEGGELRNFSPGGTIFINGGTLYDVSIVSDQNDQPAVLFGTSTGKFQGTITNNALLEMIDSSVSMIGSVSLAGSGVLRMKQSYIQGEAGTFVLGANQTLRGFGEVQTAFVNNGVVIADGFGNEGTQLGFAQRPSGGGEYKSQNKGRLVFPPEDPAPSGNYTVDDAYLTIGHPDLADVQIALSLAGLELKPDTVLTRAQVNMINSQIVALGGGNLTIGSLSRIVALGGGNIVALGGGNIIALGGGNFEIRGAEIVALGGGNLVGLNGSNILNINGGLVRIDNGGGLVGLNGSNVINGNGSTVVALGGGNIVGTNSGALTGGMASYVGGADKARRLSEAIHAAAQDATRNAAQPAELTMNTRRFVYAASQSVVSNLALIMGSGTFQAAAVAIGESGAFAPGDMLGAAGHPRIKGNFEVKNGGRLMMDLNGVTPGAQYDTVTVETNPETGAGGAAVFEPGSCLQVSLSSGFVPAANAMFTLLNAVNGVTGEFSHVSVPQLTGRKRLKVNYDATAVTLTVAQIATYEDWQESRFTIEEQADPAISGATADPDGDGLNNRLEYFMGTEPKAAGSRANVSSSVVKEPNGDRFFTLTFPRAQGMTDAPFSIERTTNLADPNGWTPAQHEIVSSVAGDGVDTLTVKVLPAIGAAPRQMFRVRVD